jgi:hypothetical protein
MTNASARNRRSSTSASIAKLAAGVSPAAVMAPEVSGTRSAMALRPDVWLARVQTWPIP